LDFVSIDSFNEMSGFITEERKRINGFIKSIENKK